MSLMIYIKKDEDMKLWNQFRFNELVLTEKSRLEPVPASCEFIKMSVIHHEKNGAHRPTDVNHRRINYTLIAVDFGLRSG